MTHRRVSLDFCADCGGGDNSDASLNFDVGATFDFSPQFDIRGSAVFDGSDYLGNGNAFGISLAWRPPSLR